MSETFEIRPSVARLAAEMANLQRTYRKITSEVSIRSGLTSSEITLLRHLRQEEKFHVNAAAKGTHPLGKDGYSAAGIRINDLAALVHCNQSVVSRQISDLEKRRLVDRRPDTRDARATLIALTEEGREELRESLHHHFAIGEMALQDWSDDDISDMADALAKLSAEFRRVIRADIPCDCQKLGKQYRKLTDIDDNDDN